MFAARKRCFLSQSSLLFSLHPSVPESNLIYSFRVRISLSTTRLLARNYFECNVLSRVHTDISVRTFIMTDVENKWFGILITFFFVFVTGVCCALTVSLLKKSQSCYGLEENILVFSLIFFSFWKFYLLLYIQYCVHWY